MKRKIIFLIIILTGFIFYQYNYAQSVSTKEEAVVQQEHQEDEHADAQHDDHPEGEHVEGEHAEGGNHGSNMFPLLFVIIALLIGAATRHFLRKSPLPFTEIGRAHV